MKKIMTCLSVLGVIGVINISALYAQESAALEAAKEAVAQPVAAPESQPAPAAVETPSSSVAPSPSPVEPLVLKQLRDHTPIPVRSSLDQANDSNGNKTLEYEEIKNYIKNVRSEVSKNQKTYGQQ